MTDRNSNIITAVIICVIVIVIGLLGIWGISVFTRDTVGNGSEKDILNEKNVNEKNNTTKKNETKNNNVTNNIINNEEIVEKPDVNSITPISNNSGGGSGSTSGKQTYNGYTMSGYIEIPKTGIKYPVLSETTTKSIETSVAIYCGPGLNQVGNTVIVGHNYRNGMFFSDNYKIENGDKIYITDLSGTKLTYVVYNVYQTTPEDSEFMTRDTNGKIEISLSTCTDDSSARIIIWARAE